MLNSEGLIVQFTGVLLYSLGGHEAHNSAAFKIHSIHSLSGGAWRWHINIFNIIATLFRVGAVRIWTIHHFRPNRSFAVRFVPGLTIFVRPVASRVIGPNSNTPAPQDSRGLPLTIKEPDQYVAPLLVSSLQQCITTVIGLDPLQKPAPWPFELPVLRASYLNTSPLNVLVTRGYSGIPQSAQLSVCILLNMVQLAIATVTALIQLILMARSSSGLPIQ